MFTKIVEQKFKYVYQDGRATRRTHIFEYQEQLEIEREEIKEFSDKITGKDNEWLKTYVDRYYRKPADDGQTLPDYLMARCERLYSTEEMQRSWREK